MTAGEELGDISVDDLSVRGVEGLVHLEKLAPVGVPCFRYIRTRSIFRIPMRSVCSLTVTRADNTRSFVFVRICVRFT